MLARYPFAACILASSLLVASTSAWADVQESNGATQTALTTQAQMAAKERFSVGEIALGDNPSAVQSKLGNSYTFASHRPLAPSAIASLMTLVSASKEGEWFLFEFLENKVVFVARTTFYNKADAALTEDLKARILQKFGPASLTYPYPGFNAEWFYIKGHSTETSTKRPAQGCEDPGWQRITTASGAPEMLYPSSPGTGNCGASVRVSSSPLPQMNSLTGSLTISVYDPAPLADRLAPELQAEKSRQDQMKTNAHNNKPPL